MTSFCLLMKTNPWIKVRPHTYGLPRRLFAVFFWLLTKLEGKKRLRDFLLSFWCLFGVQNSKKDGKRSCSFFVLQKDAKKTPKGRQANFVLHLVGNLFWTPKGHLCKKDGKKSWHLHLNVSDKTLEQQRLSFVSNVCHLQDFSCCRFFVILLVPKWNFLFHIFKLCWASHRVPKPLAVAAEMAANSPRHWGRWMWPQPYTTGMLI